MFEKTDSVLNNESPGLESLQSARGRFLKFNSKYIESIEIARGISPPRNTNFPHWPESLP